MDSDNSERDDGGFKPKHTHYGWGVTAFIILSLILGFVGGALAVRLYDAQLQDTQTLEGRQEIVLSESEVIAEVAEQTSPSVVSVEVVTQTDAGFFFDQPLTREGAGTGIIVNDDGLVLTNRHVIPDGTVSLRIILSDGTIYEDVEVVDRDGFNDIAFLRINGASGLTPAKLGDSDAMRVGDKVIAIGNALGQFDNTVTTGIISGTGRPIVAGDATSVEQLQNLFQTDAAINPGNSGGPLVNIKGEVIGVNTAVAGGAENIGFAIPINDVKPALASVLERGEIVRPFLGVGYIMLTSSIAEELEVDETEGALIWAGDDERAVVPGSPAGQAGLRADDVIVQINEQEINSQRPLSSALNKYQVGESVVVTFIRDGERQTVEVTLEAAPANL